MRVLFWFASALVCSPTKDPFLRTTVVQHLTGVVRSFLPTFTLMMATIVFLLARGQSVVHPCLLHFSASYGFV